MKDRPLVSILINNYNYKRFLGEAIDSALNQTYPHTEVIVVDDGSTDDSREIIASYQDQIIPVLKENGGQASAYNAGFAASKGDIICLLDADDIFVSEKVEKVVNVFKSHQDLGWCFHRTSLVDANTGALIGLSSENSSQEYDLRPDIRKGKFPVIGSAGSGLGFTRLLLQQILPLPESKVIKTAADRYVRLMALALSKGFFLNEQLTFRGVHGGNAYTNKEKEVSKEQHKAKGSILVAYWMRTKSPELARFTNKVFAKGIGIYWRTGGVEIQHKELIEKYLSTVSSLEKLEINLRALYYCLKG